MHGPWNCAGPVEKAFAYWDQDDALFRSETGMPGSSPAALIRQYGQELALPGDFSNPFWMHTQGWWIQWEDYLREGGDPENLEQYVAWSQQRQAVVLPTPPPPANAASPPAAASSSGWGTTATPAR